MVLLSEPYEPFAPGRVPSTRSDLLVVHPEFFPEFALPPERVCLGTVAAVNRTLLAKSVLRLKVGTTLGMILFWFAENYSAASRRLFTDDLLGDPRTWQWTIKILRWICSYTND